MIAKVRPIISLYTLAVVLLFLLGSHAIAACDSCKASEEGIATGLLEAGGPSISEGTSSGAENINLVDAPEGATPSLYKPSKPLKPEGPDQGYLNQKLSFTTTASNPNGKYLRFEFEWWQDGKRYSTTWTGFVSPDTWVTMSHDWDKCGNQNAVRVRAIEINTNMKSEWSDFKNVTIYSIPKTPVLYVPSTGCTNPIKISAQTTDDCSNEVRYQYYTVDNDRNWRSFDSPWHKSGEKDWQAVSFELLKTYRVKVRAQNSQGIWSEWSDFKKITVGSIPRIPVLYVPSRGCTAPKSVTIGAWTIDNCGNKVRYDYALVGGKSFITTGLVNSGQTNWVTFGWNRAGTYWIHVRAQNSQGIWSDWSEPKQLILKHCP